MNSRLPSVIGGAVVAVLLATAPAQATTITIGSPGPVSTPGPLGGPDTFVQTAIPGVTVTAPADGVITSWKLANASGGAFTLQVVHPSGGLYSATGATTTPGPVTGSGTQTFPADLPIKKDDLIGVATSQNLTAIGEASTPGATLAIFGPPLGGSPQAPGSTLSDLELGYNAQELLDCLVPRLKGKKVGAARHALSNAGCAAPSVKKKGGKFIRKQNPAAGTEIRGDAVVHLKAGPKRK